MVVQETFVVLFQALHQVLPAGLNWRESFINNNIIVQCSDQKFSFSGKENIMKSDSYMYMFLVHEC